MNSKGQSFDVFKLLISAIVASAILVMLFAIIGGIPTFGTDPTQKAVETVKSMYSSPGQHYKTSEVQFKSGDGLTPKTIASKSGLLSESQVCTSVGEFENDTTLFSNDGGVVTYIGSGNKNAKLSVICDDGKSLTESDIPRYQGSYNWASSCTESWTSTCNGEETCCIIALRKA